MECLEERRKKFVRLRLRGQMFDYSYRSVRSRCWGGYITEYRNTVIFIPREYFPRETANDFEREEERASRDRRDFIRYQTCSEIIDRHPRGERRNVRRLIKVR